jgi:hypothetical protein
MKMRRLLGSKNLQLRRITCMISEMLDYSLNLIKELSAKKIKQTEINSTPRMKTE